MSRVDLILHPIRMRILIAAAGRQMTAQQIGSLMPDVAQTTLYRHLNALVEGGVLSVVAENPVRGTVEKVYALIESAGRLSAEEVAHLSGDDQLRYFMIFLSTLLHDFSAYVDAGVPDTAASSNALYSKVPLYLTDAELQQLVQQSGALLHPLAGNSADPQRKRYIIASMIIPDAEDQTENRKGNTNDPLS